MFKSVTERKAITLFPLPPPPLRYLSLYFRKHLLYNSSLYFLVIIVEKISSEKVMKRNQIFHRNLIKFFYIMLNNLHDVYGQAFLEKVLFEVFLF